jgi:spermidine synthase
MEQWFKDKYTDGTEFNIRIDRHLYSGKSKVQQTDIIESSDLGRVLIIDGQLMHTEKDEFIYHEMMVHPAMAVNPQIRDVLVIGVGNGGIVAELIKYKTIQSVRVLENDEASIAVIKKFMPKTAAALSDPRVAIEICDDMKYVRRSPSQFDLIIMDVPDPFGPGENYYTKEYYGNCYTTLRENGILINQHESCFYEQDAPACQKAHKLGVKVFDIARVFQASIPTYPSGHWLFGFLSKNFHPVRDMNADAWKSLGVKTRYYNANLHFGAFALPTYVEELLKAVE